MWRSLAVTLGLLLVAPAQAAAPAEPNRHSSREAKPTRGSCRCMSTNSTGASCSPCRKRAMTGFQCVSLQRIASYRDSVRHRLFSIVDVLVMRKFLRSGGSK